MASDSNCCYCTRPSKVVKRMAIEILVLCTLLTFIGQTLAVPDYKKLHESLSLKKDSAYSYLKTNHQDGTPIVAEIGKIFKLSLDDYILKGDGTNKPIVRIFQHGRDDLPHWLSFDEEKNRLVGLPFLQDKGQIKIVLKTGYKGLKKKHKFEIDVREAKDKFHCHLGNPAFVAAAILSVDLSKSSGLKRLELLKKFSEYIDVAFHDFVIEEKNWKNTPDVAIETSGPGDYMKTKSPDIVVKWKVDCKRGIAECSGYSMFKTCYAFLKSSVSWAIAKTSCESSNGQLVIINSSSKLNSLKNWLEALNDVTSSFHVGIYKSKDSSVKWVDGQTVHSIYSYLYTTSAVCSNNDCCGSISFSRNNFYMLDDSCNNSTSYICQWKG